MKKKATNKDLFITDIDFNAGEEDLHKLFSICGKIKNIHLITDAKSGVFRGCAFVSMATAEEAKDALNMLDGTLLLDRCIGVQEARPKGSTAGAESGTEKPRREKRPRGRRR